MQGSKPHTIRRFVTGKQLDTQETFVMVTASKIENRTQQLSTEIRIVVDNPALIAGKQGDLRSVQIVSRTSAQTGSRTAVIRNTAGTGNGQDKFTIEADAPLTVLAEGRGVSVAEHALHTLVSSVSDSIVRTASAAGVQIDDAEARLVGESYAPIHIERTIFPVTPRKQYHVAVTVTSDVPEQDLRELIEKGIQSSPIISLLGDRVFTS
jgi:hypothetical protein